jgi:hypothetical protein
MQKMFEVFRPDGKSRDWLPKNNKEGKAQSDVCYIGIAFHTYFIHG